MVLPLDVGHGRTLDAEDGQPPAVHPADLDVAQLAATHEAQGAQEEILGLDHRRLPCSRTRWTGGGEVG